MKDRNIAQSYEEGATDSTSSETNRTKHPETDRHPLEQGQVLLLDKPIGWTSFNVVSRVRNWAHKTVGRRVKTGHAGTLDPLASGLLIICTGSFTKKIEEFQSRPKEYTGTFVLGSVTKSYDLESEVVAGGPYLHLTKDDILNAARHFTGDIMQVPPVFSAVKIRGKRAYELARAEKAVELSPKPVRIHEFEITRIELPQVDFRILCSKGTYIRSMARDFGEYLGCGAYLSALRRTRIGDFRIEDAQNVEEFLHERNSRN